MRKIYIDTDGNCYTTPAVDREEIETDAFDGYADEAIRFFVYIPSGYLYKEGICAEDFCQCKNAEMVDIIQAAYKQAETESLFQLEALRAENEDKQAALDAIYTGVTE